MENDLVANMPSLDDFATAESAQTSGKRWEYTYVVLGTNNWFNALQAYGAHGFEVVPAAYAHNIIIMRR